MDATLPAPRLQGSEPCSRRTATTPRSAAPRQARMWGRSARPAGLRTLEWTNVPGVNRSADEVVWLQSIHSLRDSNVRAISPLSSSINRTSRLRKGLGHSSRLPSAWTPVVAGVTWPKRLPSPCSVTLKGQQPTSSRKPSPCFPLCTQKAMAVCDTLEPETYRVCRSADPGLSRPWLAWLDRGSRRTPPAFSSFALTRGGDNGGQPILVGSRQPRRVPR
jgi:hypothetical protein